MFCIYLRTNSELFHLQHKLIGFFTELKSVYCAVRTGSLNKAVCASSFKGYVRFNLNCSYTSINMQFFCHTLSIFSHSYGDWPYWLFFYFFSLVISNQSTWVLCWLSLVVRSPPARRSLSWIQSTVDWCMVPRNWGFDLKTNSTNYPDHGHHGDPSPTRKIPMVEAGIEPGTSWLVARSSDH